MSGGLFLFDLRFQLREQCRMSPGVLRNRVHDGIGGKLVSFEFGDRNRFYHGIRLRIAADDHVFLGGNIDRSGRLARKKPRFFG